MNKQILNTCVFVAIGAFVIGGLFGTMITRMNMQAGAIKNECAHYNPKTSEFTWGPLQ